MMSSAFLPSSGSTTSTESSVGKGLAKISQNHVIPSLHFAQIKGRKGPMRSAIALFAYRLIGDLSGLAAVFETEKSSEAAAKGKFITNQHKT
jgi:hypothetical protein